MRVSSLTPRPAVGMRSSLGDDGQVVRGRHRAWVRIADARGRTMIDAASITPWDVGPTSTFLRVSCAFTLQFPEWISQPRLARCVERDVADTVRLSGRTLL